jgi:4-hydroxybenzoate polyprenyltransferase
MVPNAAITLLRSAHPGPSIAVSVMTGVLAVAAGLDAWRVVVLTLAMFAGQLSVGLSNDWIDAQRDTAVGRKDKPIALGQVSASTVRTASIAAAIVAVAVTIPLGWLATIAHVAFIASAWAYNLGLKSTVFSVAPYVVSFGLLPLIVTLSRAQPTVASGWAWAAGALLGVAAHFSNVLPDLDDDRATGVRGLPHRVGPRTTGVVIAAALAGASASIVLGPGPGPWYLYLGLTVSAVLALLCAVLVVRRLSTRLIFRLIILGALIDVALLVLSGPRLLG